MEKTIARFEISVNFMLTVYESKTIRNLHHDIPNFHFQRSRWDSMSSFNSSPVAPIIILQIQTTQLHIDKCIRVIGEIAKWENLDEVLVTFMTEFCDCSDLIFDDWTFETEEM
jgi:hypothetical protein